jgi:large subunit ribosomal protein L29
LKGALTVELKEMRELTEEELINKEQEAKKELFHLRVQLVTGKVENPARVRQLRRMIAQLKTVSREKRETSQPTYISKGKVA